MISKVVASEMEQAQTMNVSAFVGLKDFQEVKLPKWNRLESRTKEGDSPVHGEVI